MSVVQFLSVNEGEKHRYFEWNCRVSNAEMWNLLVSD